MIVEYLFIFGQAHVNKQSGHRRFFATGRLKEGEGGGGSSAYI
jgi:hypothetical protein